MWGCLWLFTTGKQNVPISTIGGNGAELFALENGSSEGELETLLDASLGKPDGHVANPVEKPVVPEPNGTKDADEKSQESDIEEKKQDDSGTSKCASACYGRYPSWWH